LLRRCQLFECFDEVDGTAALSIGFKEAATPTSASDHMLNSSAFGDLPNSISVAAATTRFLPEFQGISQWLNSAPLNVTDITGNVVLIQFWTFACINCQRTLPYINRWHGQYAAQGLRVVGVHTPEFPFERDVNDVERALKLHKITYPVPLDNDYKTWEAYQNSYWPHLFLADRQGVLRYDYVGEGAYDKTEQIIRKLLGYSNS